MGAISIENASGPSFYIMLGCVFLFAVPAYGYLKVPELNEERSQLFNDSMANRITGSKARLHISKEKSIAYERSNFEIIKSTF
jgi:hypothetical protein